MCKKAHYSFENCIPKVTCSTRARIFMQLIQVFIHLRNTALMGNAKAASEQLFFSNYINTSIFKTNTTVFLTKWTVKLAISSTLLSSGAVSMEHQRQMLWSNRFFLIYFNTKKQPREWCLRHWREVKNCFFFPTELKYEKGGTNEET